MAHLDFRQEPHDGPGCCKAQACEEVGALPGWQQGRQVFLCSGCGSDESPSALIHLLARRFSLLSNQRSTVVHPSALMLIGTHRAEVLPGHVVTVDSLDVSCQLQAGWQS